MGFDYLRDPAAISAESFRQVRAATDLSGLPPDMHGIALRLVHAIGDPSLVADLRWSKSAANAARSALKSGAPVYADCEMVAAGITRARLPALAAAARASEAVAASLGMDLNLRLVRLGHLGAALSR